MKEDIDAVPKQTSEHVLETAGLTGKLKPASKHQPEVDHKLLSKILSSVVINLSAEVAFKLAAALDVPTRVVLEVNARKQLKKGMGIRRGPETIN
jgi:hypothetical protein